MDHARSDVISWIWSNPPDEGSGLTLEFWVYLYDLHLDHTPFSYGAYDSYTNYENANEFTVYLTSRFLRVFRGTSRYDCEAQRCLNISSVSEWNHIAATLDTSTGDLKIYIGGDLVDQTVVSGDFRKPIVPKGAVILGNEQDAFAGGFDELQALDGMLDNLRLWNCVRTASEIAKGLHQRLDPADYPDMTQLLHFDEVISESQGQIIQDLSGRGESALWGRMPTLKNEMIYQTARGITPPQAPRLVASLADVYGSAIVVYLHPGEARTILLRAHAEEESDIVVTLETELAATVGGSEGTLTNLDGHAIEAGATLSHSGDEGGPIVRYTAPQSLAGPVAWSANFSYRVTDVTSGEHTVATVVIHDLSQQTVSDMPVLAAAGRGCDAALAGAPSAARAGLMRRTGGSLSGSCRAGYAGASGREPVWCAAGADAAQRGSLSGVAAGAGLMRRCSREPVWQLKAGRGWRVSGLQGACLPRLRRSVALGTRLADSMP
ncbi:hypothetical protein CYMTET_36808 [Cymbomonas tetramitiformis]|uniref:Pentraxin (PTX) domain-containing protein n=1 Tax=Cymbomonas tetramitiformis TaxID=36881 RepID=A0AAE0CHL7_9CHLO|nr:hypothetical protein CYMTET_36808 [Cymbomonas tetramitiformis]